MSNVSQWETSAANNDAAPPNGAPEGMAANTVNDTMREMMAAVARWYQDINGSLVTGGAGNAYTLSTNNNNSSLTDLPLVVFVANRANTGASTLNVDGLGAKSLRFNGAALISGAIQADTAYTAIYNAEDDAFDLVGVPTRDASTITAGTLADARLSSNVPLKDAANEYTASQLVSRETESGHWRIQRPENDEDEKNWHIGARSSELGAALWIRAVTDSSFLSGNTLLNATRSGTSITQLTLYGGNEIELNADTLDFNGDADISGTLTVGGTITGNGSGLTTLNASNLSSGTVAGARLGGNQTMAGNKTFSNNVTISGTLAVDGEATFKATGNANTNASAVHLISTLPAIRFTDSNASENVKDLWVYHSSGVFNIAIADEDGANLESGIRVVSSGGGVIAEVELNATTLDFNGDADVSGTLTNAGIEVGYRGIPVQTQNGNYTTDGDDRGTMIYKASGGAGETFTIDGSDYSVGDAIVFANQGGGDLSIAIQDDTLTQAGTGSTGTRTLADDGMAVAVKVASSEWMITGVGLS